MRRQEGKVPGLCEDLELVNYFVQLEGIDVIWAHKEHSPIDRLKSKAVWALAGLIVVAVGLVASTASLELIHLVTP